MTNMHRQTTSDHGKAMAIVQPTAATPGQATADPGQAIGQPRLAIERQQPATKAR